MAWLLIFIVNLVGFRITMETNFSTDLWGSFWIGLIEVEGPPWMGPSPVPAAMPSFPQQTVPELWAETSLSCQGCLAVATIRVANTKSLEGNSAEDITSGCTSLCLPRWPPGRATLRHQSIARYRPNPDKQPSSNQGWLYLSMFPTTPIQPLFFLIESTPIKSPLW